MGVGLAPERSRRATPLKYNLQTHQTRHTSLVYRPGIATPQENALYFERPKNLPSRFYELNRFLPRHSGIIDFSLIDIQATAADNSSV